MLIVGHSLAGKTRLAAEVVRNLYPRHSLLIPERDDPGLRPLCDAGLDFRHTVIWLDDIDDFLRQPAAVTLALLGQLATRGATIVATIRTHAREALRPQEGMRSQPCEVLEGFQQLQLERRLTEDEYERLRLKSGTLTCLTQPSGSAWLSTWQPGPRW